MTMTTRNPAEPLSTNKNLLKWVEKMAALCKPAAIHWVDGSEEENTALCQKLVDGGTFTKLNDKLWPGCFYARSDPSDVARVEVDTEAVLQSVLDPRLRTVGQRRDVVVLHARRMPRCGVASRHSEDCLVGQM